MSTKYSPSRVVIIRSPAGIAELGFVMPSIVISIANGPFSGSIPPKISSMWIIFPVMTVPVFARKKSAVSPTGLTVTISSVFGSVIVDGN